MQLGKAKLYTEAFALLAGLVLSQASFAGIASGDPDVTAAPAAAKEDGRVQEAQAQIQLQSTPATPPKKVTPATPPPKVESTPKTDSPAPLSNPADDPPVPDEEDAPKPRPTPPKRPLTTKKSPSSTPARQAPAIKTESVPDDVVDDDGGAAGGLLMPIPKSDPAYRAPKRSSSRPAPGDDGDEVTPPKPPPGYPPYPTAKDAKKAEDEDTVDLFGTKVPNLLAPLKRIIKPVFQPDEPAVEPAPPAPPEKKIPTPPRRPKPKKDADSTDEPDPKTEADFNGQCNSAACIRARKLAKINKKKIVGNEDGQAEDEPSGGGSANSRSACYGRQLLSMAKYKQGWAVAGHNPYRSHGACALAVGRFIQWTGFMGPGYDGHFGNAVDYWKRPGSSKGNMEKMGFENVIGKYNAQNAPPGAILVFRGPATNEYLSQGGIPNYRHGQTAGYWVGHITVKGDRPHQYFTDGKTDTPAITSSPRILVGVYIMKHCKTCTANLKRTCGDR